MKTTTCQVLLTTVPMKWGQEHQLEVTRPDRPEVARLCWMNTNVLKGIYPGIFNKCYSGAVELTDYELHTIHCLASYCWPEPFNPPPLPRTEFLPQPKFMRGR